MYNSFSVVTELNTCDYEHYSNFWVERAAVLFSGCSPSDMLWLIFIFIDDSELDFFGNQWFYTVK